MKVEVFPINPVTAPAIGTMSNESEKGDNHGQETVKLNELEMKELGTLLKAVEGI